MYCMHFHIALYVTSIYVSALLTKPSTFFFLKSSMYCYLSISECKKETVLYHPFSNEKYQILVYLRKGIRFRFVQLCKVLLFQYTKVYYSIRLRIKFSASNFLLS